MQLVLDLLCCHLERGERPGNVTLPPPLQVGEALLGDTGLAVVDVVGEGADGEAGAQPAAARELWGVSGVGRVRCGMSCIAAGGRQRGNNIRNQTYSRELLPNPRMAPQEEEQWQRGRHPGDRL